MGANRVYLKLNFIIMASRKDLKKVIAYISDELATEAFYLSYGSKGSTEEWIEVFNRIFTMQNDYTSRVRNIFFISFLQVGNFIFEFFKF